MTEWQPIETAPRDGRRVLLCRAKHPEPWSAHTGYWHKSREIWSPMGMYPERNPNPTHWMPLPEPPK
jgi:hypothetical protein